MARDRKKDEIEKLLGEALTFVEHIRARIEAYIAFGKEINGFIAEKRKANPEVAAALGELEGIAAQIEGRLADRRERIKAPSDLMELNEGFRKNIRDYEGPDLKDRLKKYTDDLTKMRQPGQAGDGMPLDREGAAPEGGAADGARPAGRAGGGGGAGADPDGAALPHGPRKGSALTLLASEGVASFRRGRVESGYSRAARKLNFRDLPIMMSISRMRGRL